MSWSRSVSDHKKTWPIVKKTSNIDAARTLKPLKTEKFNLRLSIIRHLAHKLSSKMNDKANEVNNMSWQYVKF